MASYLYVVCFLTFAVTLTRSTFLYGLFHSVYTDKIFPELPSLSVYTGRRISVCAFKCTINTQCKGFAFKKATKKCRMYSKCPDVRCDITSQSHGWNVYCIEGPEPKNCKEVQNTGRTCTGVYRIEYTPGLYKDVYCQMDIGGGGWTVFQKRLDGSVEFYRDWADYKAGFGDPIGEYWLGLDALHLLTTQYPNIKMYIHMVDFTDVIKNDIYTSFMVNDESDFYRISFEWSAGNVTAPCLEDTDALYNHNNVQFSTFDVDNDLDPEFGFSCAVYGKGAWWYNACLTSNLNGRYLGPSVQDDPTSNSCKGFNDVEYRPLKIVMMMLREDP